MAFSKPRPANVICEPLPYYTGKESGDYFLKCYDGVLNHQVFNTANQAWHTESDLAFEKPLQDFREIFFPTVAYFI